MRSKDIKVGMKVRNRLDGKIYSVVEIIDEEADTGCHSTVDLTYVKLDNEESTEKVHASDVFPAEIPESELSEYIRSYKLLSLKYQLEDFIKEYGNMTGDRIIDIHWNSLAPDELSISGDKLGNQIFNI